MQTEVLLVLLAHVCLPLTVVFRLNSHLLPLELAHGMANTTGLLAAHYL